MFRKFPKLGQVVQECMDFAERFRSKQYIANSALDTISARLNLAASVSSLASLDSSCITIQVIYHSVRLPTACPYNRQAVPGWTCLPGPIKSSLTSEKRSQAEVWAVSLMTLRRWSPLLIEHCSPCSAPLATLVSIRQFLLLFQLLCFTSFASNLRKRSQDEVWAVSLMTLRRWSPSHWTLLSFLHPPISAPSSATLRHQLCKQPALYIETKQTRSPDLREC